MKTILITGAAKRGGAAIARCIHERGYHVILHCRPSSLADAEVLQKELIAKREGSAVIWSQALNKDISVPPLLESIVGIVANASSYLSSDLDSFEARIDEDIQSHVTGHLQLIRLCKNSLIRNKGAVVAITDIHVERASKNYLTYQIAKGALASAVRALAVELAPHVRVNAVAPGSLEWPTSKVISKERQSQILQSIPLARTGTFEELAAAVDFLLFDATFTTGTTLNVDGGRSSFLE
jgi:pteridine reductase